MKTISEKRALERLKNIKADFTALIKTNYGHRAKSCLTCETPGACCLDAHFVNVHISRLEAKAIRNALERLPEKTQSVVYFRVEETIEKYGLSAEGDTFAQTYACPLFEKGIGCLVHATGKPVPCIQHACYENADDLPPDALAAKQENLIDDLNYRTYGRPQPWLPLPVALSRNPLGFLSQNKREHQSRQEPARDLIDQFPSNEISRKTVPVPVRNVDREPSRKADQR